MPGKRISELTALSGAGSANNDDVLIFDADAGVTKRISRSQLAEGMQTDVQVFTSKTMDSANNTLTINAKEATLEATDGSRVHEFKDVAALLADTGLVATTGSVVRTRTEGFAYKVAATAATDHHVTTAGGVKLYVQAGANGVSVDAFGAVGNGATDDTAEIQAAVDYVASTGGGVVEGTAGRAYSCGQIDAVPGTSFSGNGCTIVNTSASFLVYSGGAYNAHTQIEGFTLKPQLAPSVGSRGVWFDGGSFSGKKKVSISDIHIPRLDAITFNTVGYENCIQITNGFYPSVKNCTITGTYNPASNPAGQYVDTGILLDQQTVGGEIVHCLVSAIHTGLKAPTLSQEGVQLRSCEVVGARIGYDLGAAVFGGPGMWLTSCHANASLTCFNLSNRTDVSLVGCTAYRQGAFFEEVWIGYDLSGAYDVRMSNLNVTNNLLSGSLDSSGIRLLNTIAVTGSNIVFRQPKRAMVHQGGCSDCHFDNISFIGSGSYAATAYETASSDDKLTLGAHTLRGTWTNPYVIAQRKDAIVIELGRTKYVRIAGISSTAAETRLLTVGASPQHWRIGLTTGAGAYDYNVDLNTAGAQIGDFFDFYFNMPSAADRRVIIRNGSGGSTLATVATASSKRYGCRAVFDGTNWAIAWLNESVFI